MQLQTGSSAPALTRKEAETAVGYLRATVKDMRGDCGLTVSQESDGTIKNDGTAAELQSLRPQLGASELLLQRVVESVGDAKHPCTVDPAGTVPHGQVSVQGIDGVCYGLEAPLGDIPLTQIRATQVIDKTLPTESVDIRFYAGTIDTVNRAIEKLQPTDKLAYVVGGRVLVAVASLGPLHDDVLRLTGFDLHQKHLVAALSGVFARFTDVSIVTP